MRLYLIIYSCDLALVDYLKRHDSLSNSKWLMSDKLLILPSVCLSGFRDMKQKQFKSKA